LSVPQQPTDKKKMADLCAYIFRNLEVINMVTPPIFLKMKD